MPGRDIAVTSATQGRRARVTVELLADHPSLVPLVARWHWREWGDEEREGSESEWRDIVGRRIQRDAVPFTLLAFMDEEPVGCLSVCWDDVDADFADEGPWLSGMFVRGPARNLGIGRALVQAAESRCRTSGHRVIWLHTGEACRFYERCGWKLMRAKAALNRDAVMQRDL